MVAEKSIHEDTISTQDSTTAVSEENNLKSNEKSLHSSDTSITEEEPYTIFSTSRLIQFLIITSLTGMLSPLTGSIYFPSVNQIEAVSFCKHHDGFFFSLKGK